LGALQRAADAFDFEFAGGDLPGGFAVFTSTLEGAGVAGEHPPEGRHGALLRLGVAAAEVDS
jgi:hypothetical protein